MCICPRIEFVQSLSIIQPLSLAKAMCRLRLLFSLLFSRRGPRHSRQGIFPALGRSPVIPAYVVVEVFHSVATVQGTAVDLLVLWFSTSRAGERSRFDVVRLAVATASLADRLTRVQLASWQPVSTGTAAVAVEWRAL